MQQVLVLLALRWICADDAVDADGVDDDASDVSATVGTTGLECGGAAMPPPAAAAAFDDDDPDDGGLTRCV